MLKNRTELVKKFINEGFTHRTLSLFSDIQLKELHKKIFKEEVSIEAAKQAKEILIKKAEEELAHLQSENDTTEEELDIETDDTGNPDVDIDGTPLLREKEIEEDFESKAQQKYLYAVNPAAAEKLASKMTKKDYEDLPEYVNEDKMLEAWILKLVESKERPEITKGSFIKTIQENLGTNHDNDSPYTIGTEAQQESFTSVVEIGREMVPPMNVKVDSFDDDGHLTGYLNTPENEQVIELNICPKGDIKLDGNQVGDLELTETDRDDDGEYIGAPESTTAPVKPAPVKPVTRPGEKTRRGPFEKPKTTPKPKARKRNSLPDWLSSTNLGKSLTQHG
tara:strand:+ start:8563 stop:9570 length:1008 start_codon:yes stop_codon:yes gene_type:complete